LDIRSRPIHCLEVPMPLASSPWFCMQSRLSPSTLLLPLFESRSFYFLMMNPSAIYATLLRLFPPFPAHWSVPFWILASLILPLNFEGFFMDFQISSAFFLRIRPIVAPPPPRLISTGFFYCRFSFPLRKSRSNLQPEDTGAKPSGFTPFFE